MMKKVCKKDIFTKKIECKKGHMPFFTLNFLGEKYTTVGTRHLFSYLCCRAGLHTHLNDKYFAKLLMQSSESRRIVIWLWGILFCLFTLCAPWLNLIIAGNHA